MSRDQRPDDTERQVSSVQPKSPAEALEPARGPVRPSGPRRRKRAPRLSPWLRFVNNMLTATAVILMLVGGATFWLWAELSRQGPLAETRNFVVPRGEGAHEIAKRLESEGIIASQQMFVGNYIGRYVLSWVGAQPLQLKAGDYEIPAGASLRAVSEILGEGRTAKARVTIREGLTSTQIVAQLRNEAGLTGDIVEIPAEGTLRPETYVIDRGMTRQQLLERMQADQRKLVERLWNERQPDLPVKSIEEAITLASIVEKETGGRDERPRVAAVFVNRLRQNIRLQSDPTILYGLFLGDVAWGRPIYKSEIQQKTAHNTYQIDGLPPTPICNPGKAALEATLNPAKTNDLYFVANGQGGHVFSTNLKDHNAAVAAWRKTEQDIRSRQAAAAAPTVPKTSPKAQPVQAAVAPPAAPAPTPAPAGTEAAPPQPAAPEPATPTIAVTPTSADAGAVPLPIRKPKRQ